MTTSKQLTLQESMKMLSEMTLLDRFLFSEVMSNPEAYTAALQIILGQDELRLLTPPQAEREVKTIPWLRSIRLDVYAVDEHGTIYDTEMQAQQRNDLKRRSRYYQSMIDSSLLSPGTRNFNELNDVCVIMIMPFDLFGLDKYFYTFVSCCKEEKTLELEDGATRIFLNTRGKNDDEISPELKEFLRYVESADDELVEKSGSDRLKKIHSCVNQIKVSEEAGVRFMRKWIERMEFLEEGREEGRVEERLDLLRKLMQKQHMTAEEAVSFLEIPEIERETYLEKCKQYNDTVN